MSRASKPTISEHLATALTKPSKLQAPVEQDDDADLNAPASAGTRFGTSPSTKAVLSEKTAVTGADAISSLDQVVDQDSTPNKSKSSASNKLQAAVSYFKKHPISQMIRAWDGPLTQQLKRNTGGHGLGQVPLPQIPEATTTSVCGFCSTGCGLNIHLKDGQAVGLSPKTQYPVNLGMACPKGWEALSVLDAPDRASTPWLRNESGELVPTDWDTAMKQFCGQFKAIQKQHGPASVAFLSTGQIPTEEMALLGSLAKFGMGLVHGDGNTRQCMATAVIAYKQSFGFDAPPYTYADYEASDTLIFIGANPCIAHPIMWQRVWNGKNNPDQTTTKSATTIITVDPRRTETAAASDLHLALKPKSDLVLMYGLAHILIRDDQLDHDFIQANTEDFEDFKKHVETYTPSFVSQLTGISIEQLEQTANKIASGKAVSFWWTMGVNQSYEGTRVAQAIINIALMTGNIGKPGTGANSITGQCNAMGSRLFSNTTGLLGGHAFDNADHRAKVAGKLNIPVDRIPSENSWSYHEIIEGIDQGKIKGLWIIATNGAHSWIHKGRYQKLMNKLDFLVVQDMYHNTTTAQQADLILPAAGWGEKDGTFINSERRIGTIKKVRRAPGQALSDFAIFKLISHYWGCSDLFKDWSTPAATFEILQSLTEGQPCDITGIKGYEMLDRLGGVQWPYPASETEDPKTERRLFEDGRFYTPNQKARFIFAQPSALAEPTDDDYPMTLLTGRGTASQWHTQTRTSKSAVLRKLYPQDVYAEIHPQDAKQANLVNGQWFWLESRRGRISVRTFVSQSVQPGQLFVPMHYEATNELTHASFDPYSKQPSYKACAVRIQPIRNHLKHHTSQGGQA